MRFYFYGECFNNYYIVGINKKKIAPENGLQEMKYWNNAG